MARSVASDTSTIYPLTLAYEERFIHILERDEFLNVRPEARFFKAQRCSYPDCSSKPVFSGFGLYLGHARKSCGITVRENLTACVMKTLPPADME